MIGHGSKECREKMKKLAFLSAIFHQKYDKDCLHFVLFLTLARLYTMRARFWELPWFTRSRTGTSATSYLVPNPSSATPTTRGAAKGHAAAMRAAAVAMVRTPSAPTSLSGVARAASRAGVMRAAAAAVETTWRPTRRRVQPPHPKEPNSAAGGGGEGGGRACLN